MTTGFVGLDTDGLRTLAATLDRQADTAEDLADEALAALRLSDLPGESILARLYGIAERDRASAIEIRTRVEMAEQFRLDMTIIATDLVSATATGRAARDELVRLQAEIDAWDGHWRDPAREKILAERRALLTDLVGGDPFVAAQVSYLLDRGVELDVVLVHAAAVALDRQIAAYAEQGIDEAEALRRVDAQLWITGRAMDLHRDGFDEATALGQASWENDVAVLVHRGHHPDVASTIMASIYGADDRFVPGDAVILDAQELVDRYADELDIALARSRGDHGEADGFISRDDLLSVVDPANNTLFSPDAIVTAQVALDLMDAHPEFGDQFEKKSFLERHRDEIAFGVAAVVGAGLVVLSGGSLSPLAVVLVGVAAGAGAAATTAGINVVTGGQVWDSVAANFVSGFGIGVSAAGMTSAARLALGARAAGHSAVPHVVAAVGEGASVVSDGGVDLLIPERYEERIHDVAGAGAAAYGVYTTGQELVTTMSAVEERSTDLATLYRVQGGTEPRASRQRILIGDAGEMVVDNLDDVLYVTFDDLGRAQAFVDANRPGAGIIAFDVDADFVDTIRDSAVPQHMARVMSDMPHIADATKTDSSFGLPTEWIERLIEHAKIGTGRFVE